MANVIIVLILVAAVGYGIYSFIHHLRHGGGCCGEHDAPAKKVRAADTNKSHYPHRLVMGVDGMTCQNCQRHVENALNTLPDTLAEVNLSARNVTVWTKADADEEVIRKAIRDAGYLPLRTKEKVCFFGYVPACRGRACPALGLPASAALRVGCGRGMPRPYRTVSVSAHHCPASAVMLSQFVQSCTIQVSNNYLLFTNLFG